MEREIKFINNQWVEVKDGINKPVLLCPECRWPLAGKIKEIRVSRIGSMFFHEGCGPKI